MIPNFQNYSNRRLLTPTEKTNRFLVSFRKTILQPHFSVSPCGKCKLCPLINTEKLITNDKLNITEKIKDTGNCKERKIIYAAQSSKHKVLYIGNTGEKLSVRF